jgi:hypothetical protein
MMSRSVYLAVIWVVVAAILVAQRVIGSIRPWMRIIGRVPVPLRVAAGGVLTWFLASRVVAPMWEASHTSFLPVVVSILVGFLIISVLVPRERAREASA